MCPADQTRARSRQCPCVTGRALADVPVSDPSHVDGPCLGVPRGNVLSPSVDFGVGVRRVGERRIPHRRWRKDDCGQLAAARNEEAEGRLETLFALAQGRINWLTGRLLVAVVGTTLLALVAGLCTAIGAALVGAHASSLRLLEAGLNCLPSSLLFLGLATLLFAGAEHLVTESARLTVSSASPSSGTSSDPSSALQPGCLASHPSTMSGSFPRNPSGSTPPLQIGGGTLFQHRDLAVA